MVRETTKVKINCTVDADLATLLEQEGFRKRSEIVNAALRAYYENISDRRRAQKLALEVARKEVAFKEAEARLYSAKLDLDLVQ